jgi:iron complex transport system ATP-binding protein
MLAITNLSLSLSGQRVVCEIDLQLPAGLHVIIGPNGSGKTSLLRLLAGLAKPDKGEILWQGEALGHMPVRQRARLVSYLAQNPPIHWPIKVEALIALGRVAHRETVAQTKALVANAMQTCAVTQFADRSVGQLSGGERARVLLARMLCVGADLLLVDEPTAALDPAQQLAMMDILQAEASMGKTVLCVLHDLPLAARYADQLLVLQKGRIALQGSPKQVLVDAKMQDIFGLRFEADGHLA